MSRHDRIILMVDDDAEDQFLAGEALRAIGDTSDLRTLGSGVELLEYLNREGAYAAPETSPRPDLVLLDLNMPRMNGHETLIRIRRVPALRDLPVIVFSTSKAPSDVKRAYQNGANTYISKPQTFDELCATLDAMRHYWFDTAECSRG